MTMLRVGWDLAGRAAGQNQVVDGVVCFCAASNTQTQSV